MAAELKAVSLKTAFRLRSLTDTQTDRHTLKLTGCNQYHAAVAA